MSIGSSLKFSGLSSGLDTDSIISQLVSIERAPITRLKQQQSQLNIRMNAIQQFQAQVSAVQSALSGLTNLNAFSGASAKTSDQEIATITNNGSAQQGVYSLEISNLAQAQKISSSAQNDSTSALNISGKFLINNKMIEVASSDSLSSIAQKVNSANVGVTASILNGGTGKTYLTFSSNSTGVDKKIGLSEVDGGTTLSSLGLVSAAVAIRSPMEDGLLSFIYTNPTTAIGDLIGMPAPQTAGTFQVNGHDVSIDLGTDSLQSIANKINAADPSVSAQVKSVTKDGATSYQLQLTGSNGTPALTDSQNLLTTLGFLQNAPAKELIEAKDAQFKIDGVPMTSASNTITDVIPGATINLLKGDSDTPKKVTLSMERDLGGIKGNINNFVSAFNSLVDFVDANSKLDTTTYDTGVLFGESLVSTIRDSAITQAIGQVKGLESAFDTFSEIGITLGTGNKLSVDDGKLTKALEGNLGNVAKLFQSSGVTTDPSIKYVSSTSKTVVSGTPYAVNITQAATRAAATSGSAFSSPLSADETLTFNGSLFGSNAYTYTLRAGQTLSDAVQAINSDPKLKNLLTASESNGKLTFTAKQYGSAASFEVKSALDGAGSSGIGTTALTATGLDVKGTLNGEDAEGVGQFLTGKTGNAKTEGLQVQVTATGAGNYGTINFTRGVGQSMIDYFKKTTDSISGDLPSYNKTLQSQIDSLTEQINNIDTLATSREETLRKKFTALEETMSRLKSQSAQLNALGFTGSLSF